MPLEQDAYAHVRLSSSAAEPALKRAYSEARIIAN